jgi:hypothetical protein
VGISYPKIESLADNRIEEDRLVHFSSYQTLTTNKNQKILPNRGKAVIFQMNICQSTKKNGTEQYRMKRTQTTSTSSSWIDITSHVKSNKCRRVVGVHRVV